VKYIQVLCNFVGRYECQCPAMWNGVNCEAFDEDFPGGVGNVVSAPTTTSMPISKQVQQCVENKCDQKRGNGRCDVCY
jgi:hypothetical protein